MSQTLIFSISRLAGRGFNGRGSRIRTFLPPQNYRQLHVSIPLHRQLPPPIQNQPENPKDQKQNEALKSQQDQPKNRKEQPGKTVFSYSKKQIIASLIALAIVSTALGLRSELPLSETRFKPFKVVAREQISSTAFIITVEPKRRPSDLSPYREVLRELLRRGVWSVEIKQPQLQVARDYTPLPPLTPEEEEDMIEKCQLRFLIRRMEKGEVSTYISRLHVGDQIELRGCRMGFDVNARLGDYGNEVMFYAGGTGIASALQVAKAVLGSSGKDGTNRRVRIQWHNRRHEDCDEGNKITRMLEHMRNHYGPETLQYQRCVDGEGPIESKTDFDTSMTHNATSTSEDCIYHSSTKLITSPAEDPGTRTFTHPDYRWLKTDKDAETENITLPLYRWIIWRMRGKTPVQPPPKCQCPGKSGKNLLIASGPDGYIEYLAGKKIWAQGKELQGPVGGHIGAWQKGNAKVAADWLVLKL